MGQVKPNISDRDLSNTLQHHAHEPAPARLLYEVLAIVVERCASFAARNAWAAELRTIGRLPELAALSLTSLELRDAFLALKVVQPDDGQVDLARRAGYSMLADLMPAPLAIRAACPQAVAVWRAAAGSHALVVACEEGVELAAQLGREADELVANTPRRRNQPLTIADLGVPWIEVGALVGVSGREQAARASLRELGVLDPPTGLLRAQLARDHAADAADLAQRSLDDRGDVEALVAAEAVAQRWRDRELARFRSL